MAKKYIVRLSSEERSALNSLVKTGKAAAYKRLHAQILLQSDVGEGGPGWKDVQMSEALGVTVRTVETVRQRLVEQGLEAALNRAKPIGVKPRRLDGEQEAHLVALACSEPPAGNLRWTLRLLADHMVELDYVERVSHETIRQTLKKTKLNPGKRKNGLGAPRVSRRKPTRNSSVAWKRF